mmetsp:Transcript_16090/g.16093  ORF Transcript_16090/g.16093 Transcript_16090/m.16093 type:complete len:82 (-) Transcript_16090:75-320(-)
MQNQPLLPLFSNKSNPTQWITIFSPIQRPNPDTGSLHPTRKHLIRCLMIVQNMQRRKAALSTTTTSTTDPDFPMKRPAHFI